MSIPISGRERESERAGEELDGWRARREKVKNYKGCVENNRKLGQEAIAFGNEALDEKQQREGK